MAEVYQDFYIDLDIKYSASNREIILKEDDTGIRFHINLTDDGEPVDLSGCRIVALFAGGKGIAAQDSSMDDSGITINSDIVGRIDLDLFTSSFAVGYNECDIQVYSRDDRSLLITVPTFNFTVSRSHANEDSIVSRPEFPLLVNLVTQTEEALAAANEALDNANEAIDRAETVIGTSGDMTKAVYDTNDSGVVDDSEKLGGQVPNYYATTQALAEETAAREAITPASIGAASAGDLNNYIPTSQKGAASGVATLDANGKVTAAQASSRIVTVTASKTLAAGDAGTLQMTSASSDIVITIPPDESNSIFPVGTEIEFYRHGTGAFTITSGSGVYLAYDGTNPVDRSLALDRYGTAAIKKVTSKGWKAAGEFE